MIVVYFLGRTGNQLFQYSCARQLMHERGDKEHFAFTFENVIQDGKNPLNSNSREEYGNVLQYFNIKNYQTFHDTRLMKYGDYFQFVLYGLKKIQQRLFPNWDSLSNYLNHVLLNHGVILYDFDKSDYHVPKHDNVIMYGHFEDSMYFEDVQEELKEAFTPNNAPLKQNLKLYEIIEHSNSVCVHVRRGDYLDSLHKKNFYVCDENYYQQAISEIKKRIENPIFIFFSNDIEWVKLNITTDCPTYFEPDHNPIWETLRMMYSCKHFIISNSTFSWWGQYLCRNPKKIVVSPDKRFANPVWNRSLKSHLISSEFIKIKVRENEE